MQSVVKKYIVGGYTSFRRQTDKLNANTARFSFCGHHNIIMINVLIPF